MYDNTQFYQSTNYKDLYKTILIVSTKERSFQSNSETNGAYLTKLRKSLARQNATAGNVQTKTRKPVGPLLRATPEGLSSESKC